MGSNVPTKSEVNSILALNEIVDLSSAEKLARATSVLGHATIINLDALEATDNHNVQALYDKLSGIVHIWQLHRGYLIFWNHHAEGGFFTSIITEGDKSDLQKSLASYVVVAMNVKKNLN